MAQSINNSAAPASFIRRVLLAIGLLLLGALLAYFLWSVGEGFLVIFAGVLFAVFLDGVSRVIQRLPFCGHRLALLLAIILVAVLTAGGGWFGGRHVAAQAPQLAKQISHSLNRIHRELVATTPLSGDKGKSGKHSGSSSDSSGSSSSSSSSRSTGSSSGDSSDNAADDNSSDSADGSDVLSYGQKMLGTMPSLVTGTVSAVTDGFIILILGIYFAVTPAYYLEIAALLVPPGRRAYAVQVVNIIGSALRRWFLGRIMAMILVGVLITAGLYGLGVKLTLVLGVIAGLFTFVPYLGAIISAVPAILVGLSSGPFMAVYVAALFLAVHIIEGYVFTPLVQNRIVHIAPAFLLTAQLMAGLFAGIFGIFIAAPAAIVLTICVQKFYIEAFFSELPAASSAGPGVPRRSGKDDDPRQ